MSFFYLCVHIYHPSPSPVLLSLCPSPRGVAGTRGRDRVSNVEVVGVDRVLYFCVVTPPLTRPNEE